MIRRHDVSLHTRCGRQQVSCCKSSLTLAPWMGILHPAFDRAPVFHPVSSRRPPDSQSTGNSDNILLARNPRAVHPKFPRDDPTPATRDHWVGPTTHQQAPSSPKRSHLGLRPIETYSWIPTVATLFCQMSSLRHTTGWMETRSRPVSPRSFIGATLGPVNHGELLSFIDWPVERLRR